MDDQQMLNEREARRKMLEELRRAGKRGSIILGSPDDEHQAARDEHRRVEGIAAEFDQIDRQNDAEMRQGGIDLIAMDIVKEEIVQDEETLETHVETGEVEMEVETIDMRLDDGLKDFLREDVRQELFGDGGTRRGDVNRLTQCPHCLSKDVQLIAPPNMYCNACDKMYSYEMGMSEIENRFDVAFEKGEEASPEEEAPIIFLGDETPANAPRKIKRVVVE